MGIPLYLFLFGGIIVVALRYFIPKEDRHFALILLLFTLPIQFIVLYLINEAVPFVPSETDTRLYYYYSQFTFASLSDYFDVRATVLKFSGWGGLYLHLLTIIHQLVGDSLLWRKALSLMALWPLAFAWYRIAWLAQGKSFARATMIVIVWLPTLWYPFLVLYRDLITAMLHSVFLASFIWYLVGDRTEWRHLAVTLASGLLLFLFRSGTIVINGMLILIGLVIWQFTHGWRPSQMLRWLVLFCVVIPMGAILLSEDVTTALPLKSVGLSLDSMVFNYTAEAAPTGMTRIPVGIALWLASEPSIMSKRMTFSDPEEMRGIMNGPWFIFGVPFAALGLAIVLGVLKSNARAERAAHPGSQCRSPSELYLDQDVATSTNQTVLFMVAGYCLVWLLVCMQVWDWTRWRLPVVPALALIAVWGFQGLQRAERAAVFLVWLSLLAAWRFL